METNKTFRELFPSYLTGIGTFAVGLAALVALCKSDKIAENIASLSHSVGKVEKTSKLNRELNNSIAKSATSIQEVVEANKKLTEDLKRASKVICKLVSVNVLNNAPKNVQEDPQLGIEYLSKQGIISGGYASEKYLSGEYLMALKQKPKGWVDSFFRDKNVDCENLFHE